MVAGYRFEGTISINLKTFL